MDGATAPVPGARTVREPGAVPPARSSIVERQDSADMILLLKAVVVSHTRARRLDAFTVLVSLVLVGLGLAAIAVPALGTPVAVAGALWAVGYGAGLVTWARDEWRRAAVLQEMFDVELFGLRWNPVAAGEQIGAQEVSWLARRYHGDVADLRGYYEIPALPSPYDVIACQLQNLAWGARIRRRYARLLRWAVALWCAAGLVVAAVGGLTVVHIALRWYLPSLGALLLAWDSARDQRAVAAERERVMGILWHDVRAGVGRAGARAALLETARQVQDAILLTRRTNVRVPDWFFARFKRLDRVDFQAVMAELVRVVGTAARESA